MAVLLEAPYSQFFDDNGNPLSGGKVYTYIAGTTTNKATYTDSTEVTQAANPIILDSSGRALIWVLGSYDFRVETAAGALIKTTPNYSAYTSGGDMTKAVYDPANIVQQVVGTTAVQTLTNKTIIYPAGTFSGIISGLLPSAISGTSTTAAVTISAGSAADSTGASIIIGAGYSWAVSNGNALNGYSGGATLPNSSTIHFFIIQDSAGANQGSFASTSLTPTLPASHTGGKYRRTFSLRTTAAGALIADVFNEIEGGGLLVYLGTAVADFLANATTTAANITTSCPTGIVVRPKCRVTSATAGYNGVLFSALSQADVAPTINAGGGFNSVAPGSDFFSTSTAGINTHEITEIVTNTSAQFRVRATATVALQLITDGYKDARR